MAVAAFEVSDRRKSDMRHENALLDRFGKALSEVFAFSRLDRLFLDERRGGIAERRKAPSVRMAFGVGVEFAENVVCPDSPLRGYSKHLTHGTPPSTHSVFPDVRPKPLAPRQNRRANRCVYLLQLRNRGFGSRMDFRVDFRLVFAEVADDARMVGRKRVRRLRHASRLRHSQRLSLQSEVPFERIRPQFWKSYVEHVESATIIPNLASTKVIGKQLLSL